MTIKEALTEIRSQPKWYFVSDGKGGIRQATHLIQTAQRIEDGRAKPETVRKFLAQFGYELELNMEARKRG